MHSSTLPRFPLLSVREFADVYVDAAVRDTDGELLFLSLFGRDAMLLQLLAALTLPVTQGGQNRLTLIGDGNQRHSIAVTHADRLEKLSGKFNTQLFGEVGHLWLYDPLAINFDRSNRRALLLRANESEAAFEQRCWATICLLSSVGLMEHWCAPLLEALGEHLLVRLAAGSAPPIGAVDGVRVELGDHFEAMISIAVANGGLQLSAEDQPVDCVERIRFAMAMAREAPVSSCAPAEVAPIQRGDGLFALGQIVATPGVTELVTQGLIRPADLLNRHRAGDWGVVSAEDARSNAAAVSGEARILSAYPIDPAHHSPGYGDNTVWVITEADRSATTLLLPSEY